jgi:hypothetical protein
MLTTLERMSWLLIILATITLTAFLQPGMEAFAAGNAAKVDPHGCLSTAQQQFKQSTGPLRLHNITSANATQPLQLPLVLKAAIFCSCSAQGGDAHRRYSHGFQASCARLWNSTLSDAKSIARDSCQQLRDDVIGCFSKMRRLRSGAVFALFTTSSFCVTLVCLMLIVVVSLPRLKCTDLTYEAGRLWLFLLFIWFNHRLFVEAVQLAFMAFWWYALAVYDPLAPPFDAVLFSYSMRVEFIQELGNIPEASGFTSAELRYALFMLYGHVVPSLGGGLFTFGGFDGVSMCILATTLMTVPP